MKKQILLLFWILYSFCAVAQFSGAGPVVLTTPNGATNIQWYEVTSDGAAIINGIIMERLYRASFCSNRLNSAAYKYWNSIGVPLAFPQFK